MRITCVCVYAIVIVLAMVHKTFEILSLFFLDISLQDICNVPKNIILYVDSTRFVLVAYTQFLDTLDIRRLSCIHHHALLLLAHTHTHSHTTHPYHSTSRNIEWHKPKSWMFSGHLFYWFLCILFDLIKSWTTVSSRVLRCRKLQCNRLNSIHCSLSHSFTFGKTYAKCNNSPKP